MRRIMGKLQQALSIILTVAMVITCIPQTGLTAFAAELDTIESTDLVDMEEDVELEVSDSTEDTGNTASDDQEDVESNTSDDTDDIDSETPGDGEDTETEVPDSSEQPDTDEEQEMPEENQEEPDDGLLSGEETEGPLEEDISVSENMILDGAGESYIIPLTLGANGRIKFEDTDKKAYSMAQQVAVTYVVPVDAPDSACYFKVKPTGTDSIHRKVQITARNGGLSFIEEVSEDGEIWELYRLANPNGNGLTVNFNLVRYNTIVEYDSAIVEFQTTSGFEEKDSNYTVEATSTTAKFSAVVKEELQNDYAVRKVEYKSGDATEVIEPDDDGSYTLPKVVGDGTITITTGKLFSYKAAFIADDMVERIKDITVTKGIVPEMLEFTGFTENGENKGKAELAVVEGSDLKFKLAAKPYYEITKVKTIKIAEDTGEETEEVLTPDDNGFYTIQKVTEDVTYYITSEKLENVEGYYSLVFEKGEGPVVPESIDVELEEDTTDQDTVSVQGTKSIGESITTKNQKWLVSITVPDGYEVEEVLLNGKNSDDASSNLEKKDEGVYLVTLTENAADLQPDKLTISTALEKTKEKNTITFIKKSKNLKYEVVNGGGLERTDTINKYEIPAGTAEVTFKVTIAEAYAPLITFGTDEDKEQLDSTGTPVELKKSKEKQYTYTIPATRFAQNDTIVLDEEAIDRILQVTYGRGHEDEVDVLVSINGKKLEVKNNNAYAGYWEYQGIPLNAAVTIKVTAKNNCSLTSITGQAIGTTKATTKKAAKGVAEITVTAVNDINVTVVSAKTYKADDLRNESANAWLAPVKNIYTVSYDAVYTATAYYGSNANNKVAFIEAEALNGKQKLENVVTLIEDGKKVRIQNLDQQGLAGKTITLNLYVDPASTPKRKPVVTYKLKITQPITKVTVPTALQKQSIDTIKQYNIAVNSGAEIDRLEARVAEADKDKDVVTSAKISKNAKGKSVVEVTTGQSIDGTAVVEIYDKKSNEPKASFTVNTIALLDSLKTAAPSVKLTKADDVELTLSVTAKKIETPKPGGGAVFYEVIATALDPDKEDECLKSSIIEYVKKSNDTQVIPLKMAKDGISLGGGRARDYNVEVRLVYTKEGTVAKDSDGKITNAAESSKRPNKPSRFSTKVPKYETALKLKKSKTTIYTGQEEIQIATAVFNKPTTYMKVVAVEDITEGIAPNNRLELEISGDNIIASAGVMPWNEDTAQKIYYKHYLETVKVIGGHLPTKPGKHKIKVTARAADGMYAASATMDVTVLQGIMDAEITIPSDTLYKAAKKQVSFKPTVIYNHGIAQYAPKTKKVAWRLEKQNAKGEWVNVADDPVLSKVCTVNQNNGTVTIKKDYILSDNPEENKFRLRISPLMDKDNKVLYGSFTMPTPATFTVTNEDADIWGLAIVTPAAKDQYKVLKVQEGIKNTTVSLPASELKDAELVVLNSAAGIAYSNGKLGENGLITQSDRNDWTTDGAILYKSSSAKNIAIDAQGVLTVNKPVKAKLTATVNDGSKKKAEITVQVGYDTPPEIGLELRQFKGSYEIATDLENLPEGDGTYAAQFADPIYTPANANQTDVQNGIVCTYKDSSYFEVNVMYRDGEEWKRVRDDESVKLNYTLSVKGGQKKELATGTRIIVTANEATITLTDKVNKTANNKPVVYTYKLINANGGTLGKPTLKVTQNFHEQAAKEDQKAVIQVTDNKIWQSLSSEYEGEQLYARVEADWTLVNTKNDSTMRKTYMQMFRNNERVLPIDDERSFTITADHADYNQEYGSAQKSYIEMIPGSYKLKVVVGTVTDAEKPNTTFQPKTVAGTVTVKVVKNQKMTYKPTASYTIGTRDGRGVYLTGKSNIKNADEYTVQFANLKNANISGQPNDFTTYFEIVGKEGEQKIQLKQSVTEEQLNYLKNPKNKNSLIGYFDYTMTSKKEYYKSDLKAKEVEVWESAGSKLDEGRTLKLNTIKGTVKVTIKLNDTEKKAVAKYTFAKPAMSNLKDSSTEIKLAVNGHPVDVKYAYLESKDTFWKQELETTDGIGNVKLTLTEDVKKGAKSATLWIVSTDSYYINKFTSPAQGQQLDLSYYQRYATPVKVSITLNDTLTETKTAITKWSAKINSDIKKNSSNPFAGLEWLNNKMTEKDLLDEIAKGVTVDSRITVDIAKKADGSNDFTITNATAEKAGTIKGNLLLKSKNGDTLSSVKVAFTITIPKGATEAPTPVTPEPDVPESGASVALNPAIVEETKSAA